MANEIATLISQETNELFILYDNAYLYSTVPSINLIAEISSVEVQEAKKENQLVVADMQLKFTNAYYLSESEQIYDDIEVNDQKSIILLDTKHIFIKQDGLEQLIDYPNIEFTQYDREISILLLREEFCLECFFETIETAKEFFSILSFCRQVKASENEDTSAQGNKQMPGLMHEFNEQASNPLFESKTATQEKTNYQRIYCPTRQSAISDDLVRARELLNELRVSELIPNEDKTVMDYEDHEKYQIESQEEEYPAYPPRSNGYGDTKASPNDIAQELEHSNIYNALNMIVSQAMNTTQELDINTSNTLAGEEKLTQKNSSYYEHFDQETQKRVAEIEKSPIQRDILNNQIRPVITDSYFSYLNHDEEYLHEKMKEEKEHEKKQEHNVSMEQKYEQQMDSAQNNPENAEQSEECSSAGAAHVGPERKSSSEYFKANSSEPRSFRSGEVLSQQPENSSHSINISIRNQPELVEEPIPQEKSIEPNIPGVQEASILSNEEECFPVQDKTNSSIGRMPEKEPEIVNSSNVIIQGQSSENEPILQRSNSKSMSCNSQLSKSISKSLFIESDAKVEQQ